MNSVRDLQLIICKDLRWGGRDLPSRRTPSASSTPGSASGRGVSKGEVGFGRIGGRLPTSGADCLLRRPEPTRLELTETDPFLA
jgi:hypothetical protein